MTHRPHPRKARTSSSSPRAWGTCQRCGFVCNQEDLSWQFDWRGLQLMNLQILVCSECLDNPQRQLGTIILPPDPVSIINARPEPYAIDEYANIIFENATPFRAGEPIYAEDNSVSNEAPIIMEIPQYYETT